VPQQYIGKRFDTLGGESTANAEVSLVGSHLQNVCIEVESDAADISFILSPVGARKMIDALQAALVELKEDA
jgi:hypothetical protein